MHLEGLLPIMRQLPSYPALLDRLRSGGTTPDQHLLRAARPFVSAALAQDLDRPVLKVDQIAEPDKLLRHWLSIGYIPASVVVEPGTFNRRGGIIDVFPINAERPVRIEFFGDTIESLRLFDPATQRSSDNVKQAIISPAREALPKLAEEVAGTLREWFLQQPSPD